MHPRLREYRNDLKSRDRRESLIQKAVPAILVLLICIIVAAGYWL